jgi:hypothetical protein
MSLLDNVSPQDFQRAVCRGYERLSAFRAARVKFLRAMTGGYYDNTGGGGAAHTLNVIFHACRVLIPNLVLNYPKHVVDTPYLEHKEYAELMGLALSYHDKKIRIRDKYCRAIMDAITTLGILKTGLGSSDSVITLDDNTTVDPGEVYTEVVDFDNFVVDPNSREHMFKDATWMGDRIQIPREALLDSGLYDNELVEKLPRIGTLKDDTRASDLSMVQINVDENYEMEDMVEIVELWVPSDNSVVTVAGGEDTIFEDFLRVSDYYGVDEGPYTLMSFSPPVSGNPLPVPIIGTWYDVAISLNRVAKKEMENAEAKKTVYAYKRQSSDDANAIRDAMNGQGVACDDPDSVKPIEIGGQKASEMQQVQMLMDMFNTFANNPNQIGGFSSAAKSATAANMLQQNANIGLEDMRDKVYIMASEEARRRAFYFHTDPLIHIPMVKSEQKPATSIIGMDGQPIYYEPPSEQQVQTTLTPEMREGDFFDFTFTIEPESMTRMDSKGRLQTELAFSQQVLPGVTAAAQAMQGIGIPFNARGYLIRMARDAGIDWLQEVLMDPQFAQEYAMRSAMGPQPDGNTQAVESKTQQGQPNAGANPMAAIAQNGQPGQVMGAAPGQLQIARQAAQAGAQNSQRLLGTAVRRSIGGTPALAPNLGGT